MRDQIIIRMPAFGSDEPVSWIKLGNTQTTPVISYGELSEIASEAIGAQLIALVPGTDVLLTRVSLPIKNKQRLLKALPYALEEELASDVEELHFAIGPSSEDENLPVAALENELMDAWQELFKEAGLSVDVFLPDVFAVPFEENSWSLVFEGGHAIVRTGLMDGFSVDVENIGVVLPLVLKAHAEDRPSELRVWQNNAQHTLTPLISDIVDVVHQPEQQGILGIAASQGLALDNSINLLQGKYSRREQFSKIWRPWRVAASLAAVWFVMQLAVAITQSSQLEDQSATLKAETVKVYRDTFPNAKKVIKPRAQMEQKLKELQGQGGSRKVTFLSLLSDSGKAFKQTPGLNLRSIRFKNGVLDVDLEVPNLQTLDQLKQSLSKQKGMSVEIQSAASRNNIVQGRLQIKGQAS